MKARRSASTVLALNLTYVAIIAVFLIPIVWLVSLAFRIPAEALSLTVNPIPRAPTFANFAQVLQTSRLPVYLRNGLVLALSGAAGALCFSAPAGYALSRLRFRRQRPLLLALLFAVTISPLAIILPLYQYVQRLGLGDSMIGTALIYIAIAAPLSTWVLKSYFDTVPREVDEAAVIDGCTRFGAFFRIVLPLSTPGLAASFILTAILGWSQFVVPFILLGRPDLVPISVGIFNYLGTYSGTAPQLVITYQP